MWRNTDVETFLQWLRRRNEAVPQAHRAGFYGLDLYSLGASIRAVIDYLERTDPKAAAVARERYGCLTPWSSEPQAYGRLAVTTGFARCERPVVEMLRDLLTKRLDAAGDDDEFLDAEMNAALVRDAEAYYRAMYFGAAESWNLRDRHMANTLERVLQAAGPDAKAVVWAHNSHIGDARFTEMGLTRGELNLGQLCRELWGEAQCALIGFGTHAGRVAAASDWDGPMEVRTVLPSRADSYERQAHETGLPRWLIDLDPRVNGELHHKLLKPRLERFIGVIYRPDTERWSHYSECFLSRQFDAYVWFDETMAVTPLPTEQRPGPDETYPFGL
jgi:erythromycin esterase-like protein